MEKFIFWFVVNFLIVVPLTLVFIFGLSLISTNFYFNWLGSILIGSVFAVITTEIMLRGLNNK